MNPDQQSVAVFCADVSTAWIRPLEQCITRVQVFSPYTTSDVAERAMAGPFPHVVELYTRFDLEAFASGASSLETLDRLLARGHPVYDVPRLHAKIYVVSGQFATIGSQNLTARGRRNREASVMIRDPIILERLRRQLTRWAADRRPITRDMVADAKSLVTPLEAMLREIRRSCRKGDRQIAAAEAERQRLRAELCRKKEYALAAYREKRAAMLASLGDEATAPEKLCRDVLWNATEWNPRGKFVSARRDALRMQHGKWGWELPLGENRFLVGLAVSFVRSGLEELFSQDRRRSFLLSEAEKQDLQSWLRRAVAGHGNRRFTEYPVDGGGRMWLGNHAINLSRTLEAILHFCGIE